ncbi:hypothetical protein PPACK8108_LOCUS10181 [Phakopsora pachyrhizi]|uniref:Phospholipid/glycerol acyltransferase domain-containing protein n=1 Tax=Phakopsora pachyrhizi TaxID=170000 RepID=A0AAV0AXV7_PHAPC|nr:hypothetical protein PPACK8108_LOCUS10181 [Phakopsora pachyrhizi]
MGGNSSTIRRSSSSRSINTLLKDGDVDDGDQKDFYVANFPTVTPLAYRLVITLFRFVLAIFFSRIVIENRDQIPSNGRPTIVLVNHSNSLTDALIIMASIPRRLRRMLRMTAKATHFRRGNFSSWLIEKAGSVPLQRAQDYQASKVKVDNSLAKEILIEALCRQGDAICMFPEGISRYHPQLAPLKTGAARIASEVLYQSRGLDKFELNLLTCSITYLHRQNFRSDVLVSFHEPIKLRPHGPLEKELISDNQSVRQAAISRLTSRLSEQIRSGTLDSPSWEFIKAGNMARTIYAPFGTRIGLGPHIRLTQKFVDVFAGRGRCIAENLTSDVRDNVMDEGDGGKRDEDEEGRRVSNEELVTKLLEYQSRLYSLGIKDERVTNNRLTSRRVIIKRLIFRSLGALILVSVCVPGLVLWTPTFVVTKYFANKQKLKGPAWDTYDEVTQTKILWGLVTGSLTYLLILLITFPILPITLVFVPLLMWLTLRWLEDLVSSLRAARSLYRMLMLGKVELNELRERRKLLSKAVLKVAVEQCGLPRRSQELLLLTEGLKKDDDYRLDESNTIRKRDDDSKQESSNDDEDSGGKNSDKKIGDDDDDEVLEEEEEQEGEIEILNKDFVNRFSRSGYFSLRRRRKKDYNEVLRLWDVIDM